MAAWAFDIARYLLPFGVSTGVGQVTSIRTLEKQIRRLKASEFGEVRGIGDELSAVCAAMPECAWEKDSASEPVAPTLARYAERVHHPDRLMRPLRRIGAKGSGAFAPISWDDALDLVAEKFLEAERRYGAQAVWVKAAERTR